MKRRSFLALLAAACIIVLGALLPKIEGFRQDAVNDNQLLFASVNEVQLEFSQDGRTMKRTIAIPGQFREAVDIPEDLASLKREKVENIAAATATRYSQAGVIFQEVEDHQIQYCQPVLAYGQENESNVYWTVHYGDPKGSQIFYLTIDDRTGTVCSIEYMAPDSEYVLENLDYVLSNFCEIYLSGLGEEFYDYEVEDILKRAESRADMTYLASQISWEEEGYGECEITFLVNANGFYTYIS